MISPSGLILALSTAVMFAIFGLLSRVLAKESESPLALSIVYGFFTTILAFVLLLLEPWQFGDLTGWTLFITFLATAFYGITQVSEFFARKHMEASRLTIFYQLTPVFTLIFGAILLSESFSVAKVGAIALIVAGNIIALYKHGGHITKTGLF